MMSIYIKVTCIILLFYCYTCNTTFAQVQLTKRCKLPAIVHETSGIEVNANDTTYIWTHNDSGDSAFLYKISTNGILLRKLKLIGVNAIDIEDLTQDDNGNYYVGDFGNNNNDRTDLTVYKIPNPDNLMIDSVLPQAIHFSYPDQTQFPPPDTKKNFDCESMFHFGTNLYLFSKNRGSSTACKMYVLPDSAGTYIATLLDSFNTNSFWITSADISPDKSTVVLLNELEIHVFKNFTADHFLQGTHTLIDLGNNYTQKEAIVFVDNNTVYITDEKFSSTGGNLYYLNINNVLTSTKKKMVTDYILYPNPAGYKVIVELKEQTNNITVEVVNLLGQKQDIKFNTYENKIELDIRCLTNGQYQVSINSNTIHTRMLFTKE